MWLPWALAMKRGVASTLLQARTGLLTPPGMYLQARSNNASEECICAPQ
jgi:hypothetical protein